MEFRIVCSGCGKRYRVNMDLVGKFLKCKRCETYMEISDPSAEPEEVLTNDEIVEVPPSQTSAGKHVLPGRPGRKLPAGKAPRAASPQAPVHPTGSPPVSVPQVPIATPAGYDPLADFPASDLQSAGSPGSSSVPVQHHGQHSPVPLPVPVQHAAPAYGHPPVATPWQQAGAPGRATPNKQKKLIGGLERACILFGAFLLVFGLLILLGVPIPRLQDSGNLKLIVGMLMGLIGTAVLATGFRNVKIGSMISGAGGALATFAAFAVAISMGTSNGIEGGNGGNMASNSGPDTLSLWYKNYPNWTAAGTTAVNSISANVGWRASDIWPDQEMHEIGAKAKFPTSDNIKRQAAKQELNEETVNVSIFKHSISTPRGAFLYAIRQFDVPNPEYTEDRILKEIEKGLKSKMDAIDYKSQDITVENFSGKEIECKTQLNGAEVGVHQRIILRNKTIYLVFVSGPSSMVPGAESNKFLKSLVFDSSWRPSGDLGDAPEGPSDALDPFTFGSGEESQPAVSSGFFQVPQNEVALETEISLRRRKLESLMDNTMGQRIRLVFPVAYLAESAGSESRSRSYFVHPQKLPIIGVDVTISRRGSDQAIHLVAPLYDDTPTNSKSIMARKGYGIGAANVTIRDNGSGVSHVVGLQFIFMKVTDLGFDIEDNYKSDWIGEAPSSGNGIRIGSDGRPVYGFWMGQGVTLGSIGLIWEAEYRR